MLHRGLHFKIWIQTDQSVYQTTPLFYLMVSGPQKELQWIGWLIVCIWLIQSWTM